MKSELQQAHSSRASKDLKSKHFGRNQSAKRETFEADYLVCVFLEVWKKTVEANNIYKMAVSS